MRKKALAKELPSKQTQKSGVLDKITFPEPPRLGHKAKQPFQASPHHPSRRLRCRPRSKVKRGAYSNHYRINSATVVGHPPFLFWISQADEQNL
jgi:hypothetical protein